MISPIPGLICVSSFIMFMKITSGLSDKFYQLIAFGLGVTYIFQIFLTIGGGTKFIPLTGVTLPLISYGGSSVLTTLAMFSIAGGLQIIMQDEEDREKEERKKRIAVKKKRKKAAISKTQPLTAEYNEEDVSEYQADKDLYDEEER